MIYKSLDLTVRIKIDTPPTQNTKKDVHADHRYAHHWSCIAIFGTHY